MNYYNRFLLGLTASIAFVQAAEPVYDSAIVKCVLSDQNTQKLLNKVGSGVNQTKQALDNANIFFHPTKPSQAHITLEIIEPNHRVHGNYPNYYNFTKDVLATITESGLAPSYSGYITKDQTSNGKGVGLFVSGYAQNGQKINKHYWSFADAQADFYNTFTFRNHLGELKSSVVACHYVLAVNSTPTSKIVGPLEKDIATITETVNAIHDQGEWINPYKGTHDKFVGHFTVGVAKARSGKITQNSERISIDHLPLLLQGYKNIQDCFQRNTKNTQLGGHSATQSYSAGHSNASNTSSVAAPNAQIQAQYETELATYEQQYLQHLKEQLALKIQGILTHHTRKNRPQADIDRSIANLNMNFMWNEARKQFQKPSHPAMKLYETEYATYEQQCQQHVNQQLLIKIQSIIGHHKRKNSPQTDIETSISNINMNFMWNEARKQFQKPSNPAMKPLMSTTTTMSQSCGAYASNNTSSAYTTTSASQAAAYGPFIIQNYQLKTMGKNAPSNTVKVRGTKR